MEKQILDPVFHTEHNDNKQIVLLFCDNTISLDMYGLVDSPEMSQSSLESAWEMAVFSKSGTFHLVQHRAIPCFDSEHLSRFVIFLGLPLFNSNDRPEHV